MPYFPPLPIGGGGYSIIEDSSTPCPPQTTINFIGLGVTATDGILKTNVTIPGTEPPTAGKILLAIPFPAKREAKMNIVDATVTPQSRINAWLSGLSPEVVGSGDAVDSYNIQPIAKTGSFDLILSFLTPFAGSLSISYQVLVGAN